MFGFLKFVFFCVLAIVIGLAAVSIPIEGKTGAEHLRALVEEALDGKSAAPAPAPERGSPPRMARQRPSQPADRPPAETTTDEDRAALKQLIGEKVR